MFADFLPRSFVDPVPAGGAPPPDKYVTAVALSAAAPAVFGLLADIETLPRWAPEFCERIDLDRGEWRALTTVGEARCSLVADDAAGTVGLRLVPEGGVAELQLPFRVRARPAGGTLVTLTLVRERDQPEEQFERQRRSLVRALGGLNAWFDARSRPDRTPRPRPAAQRSTAFDVNLNRPPAT